MLKIKEIDINKFNKSITFQNRGIGFTQIGIAGEILDLIDDLQQENKQLKDNWNKLNKKYENAVEDYEQTMFEKEQLKKQLEEYKDNYNCLLKQKDAIDKAIEYNKKNIHSQTLYKILKGESNNENRRL